ncbi:MAG: hypothetical protein GY711_20915 [bacterium]|nr:hypothetical protein [bacterium]
MAATLAQWLKARCVMAMHAPPYGSGHAATQLWLMGPDGSSPGGTVRTLAAHCAEGSWSWHASGAVQDLEEPERYGERRIRDRFRREDLVRYLERVGVRVDDGRFFGRADAFRHEWVDRG